MVDLKMKRAAAEESALVQIDLSVGSPPSRHHCRSKGKTVGIRLGASLLKLRVVVMVCCVLERLGCKIGLTLCAVIMARARAMMVMFFVAIVWPTVFG